LIHKLQYNNLIFHNRSVREKVTSENINHMANAKNNFTTTSSLRVYVINNMKKDWLLQR